MRKTDEMRTKAANIIRAKSAEARVWASTVNWPVTLWRWTWHVLNRVVMLAAIGCLAVDVLIYVVVKDGMIIATDSGTSIQPEQIIEAFQYIFLMKAACAFIAYFFVLVVGLGGPETAYKRDTFRPISD